MARIRTIKPEFFIDDGLAELSPLHRLLFIGLWTQADRAGRLDDRPKRIKVAVLPFDDCDVDAMLSDLERGGFVVRYEVDGARYLEIPGFRRHQQPHLREAESSIPEPSSCMQTQHRTSTVPAPDEHGASTGRAPDEPVGREGKGREGKGRRDQPAPDGASSADADPGPSVSDLQAVWNASSPPLPRWAETSPTRAKRAKARLRERPIDGPGGWRAVVERIAASPFCLGTNDRGWAATADWLLQPDTAAKVLEGKYDGRSITRRTATETLGLPAPAPEVDRQGQAFAELRASSAPEAQALTSWPTHGASARAECTSCHATSSGRWVVTRSELAFVVLDPSPGCRTHVARSAWNALSRACEESMSAWLREVLEALAPTPEVIALVRPMIDVSEPAGLRPDLLRMLPGPRLVAGGA